MLTTVRTHHDLAEARSIAWFRLRGREPFLKCVYVVRDRKGRPTKLRDYVFTTECPTAPVLPEVER